MKEDKKYIKVPVCNTCGKSHFGRKEAKERCWCDKSDDYHFEVIEEEI